MLPFYTAHAIPLVRILTDLCGAPDRHPYELYRVAFRKTIYRDVATLQADLDHWLEDYNGRRSHQGRWCYGKTPMQTFLDTVPLAQEKLIPSEERVSTPPHWPRGRAERAVDGSGRLTVGSSLG